VASTEQRASFKSAIWDKGCCDCDLGSMITTITRDSMALQGDFTLVKCDISTPGFYRRVPPGSTILASRSWKDARRKHGSQLSVIEASEPNHAFPTHLRG